MLMLRRVLWAALLPLLLLITLLVSIVMIPGTTAQDPTPFPYTPGVPLFPITPSPVGGCYTPLPIRVGDVVYLQPGLNVRNAPSRSGAIAWNTVYENRDDSGELVDEPTLVQVTVLEGPVCSEGYNWWRVVGTGNPGWVAEGRLDEDGYYIIVPEIARNAPCTPRYNLAPGREVDLVYNVRIREAPSLDALTKTVVPFNTPIAIVGGPQCVDGLLWWVVRATVVNIVYEGWMAEGENELDFLIPEDLPAAEDGTLCAFPLPLSIGTKAYVRYRDDTPKALRTAPGEDSPLLFTLVKAVPFIIEGGPICKDNLNWWKIRVLSSFEVVGWMAEGSAGIGYWISTIDPDEFRYETGR
jgi:hypothetical protein